MTTDDSKEEAEVRDLLQARVTTIEGCSWEDLDRFETTTEQVTTTAGSPYRVVSEAVWDMGEWKSGVRISVRAYASMGWRRWWPYRESGGRGGPQIRWAHLHRAGSRDRDWPAGGG